MSNPSYVIPTEEELNSQYNNKKESKFFSVPAGGTNIFLCPAGASSKHKSVFHTLYKHENMGGKDFFELCPKRMKNEDCPICKANNELWDYVKMGSDNGLKEKAQDLSKSIYAKEAYLYNVIAGLKINPTTKTVSFEPREGMEEPKILPWVVSESVHKQIEAAKAFANNTLFNPTCATILQVSKGANGVYDKGPNKGKPIVKNTLKPAGNGMKLDAQLMALLNNIPDLSEVFPFKSSEELKSLADAKLSQFRAEKNLTVINTPFIAHSQPLPNATASVVVSGGTPTTSGSVVGAVVTTQNTSTVMPSTEEQDIAALEAELAKQGK